MLKYNEILFKSKIETLENKKQKYEEEILEQKSLIQEKEYEIARLKALLNMDGTNHGIPTSQTPIHKKKVIPNTNRRSKRKRRIRLQNSCCKKKTYI